MAITAFMRISFTGMDQLADDIFRERLYEVKVLCFQYKWILLPGMLPTPCPGLLKQEITCEMILMIKQHFPYKQPLGESCEIGINLAVKQTLTALNEGFYAYFL